MFEPFVFGFELFEFVFFGVRFIAANSGEHEFAVGDVGLGPSLRGHGCGDDGLGCGKTILVVTNFLPFSRKSVSPDCFIGGVFERQYVDVSVSKYRMPTFVFVKGLCLRKALE